MTTDNRTNEPTEAQVEAAAKELAAYEWVNWEAVPSSIKDRYIDQARAALVAAQGAAPPLPSSGVDEDKLAEAWERGHAAFEQAWESDHLFPYDYATDNPYRKEKNE